MEGCTKANCMAEAAQVQNDSKYLWLISGGFTSFSPVAITRDSISIVQWNILKYGIHILHKCESKCLSEYDRAFEVSFIASIYYLRL